MNAARERLLIVGAGMAAGKLVERLLEYGYPGEITLTGDEPVAGYNRVLLPGVVSGACSADTLTTRPPGWFSDRGVRTVLGNKARNLNLAARQVRLADGTRLAFDRLVLATGATAPLPDIPGVGLTGVSTLRSLDDAHRLRALATGAGAAVVVGGGLLGLETAQSLLELGGDVHVVHRHPRLLNRQLDGTAADILARTLEARGLALILGTTPVALEGDGRVRAVRLGSGTRLPASTVVFATGTRPNDTLAAAAGIRCASGVIVDECMRTSQPGVFAIGECARACGSSYTLVEPVFRQAEVLARVLTGQRAAFQPPPPATRLKVSGLALFSAGEVNGAEGDDADHVCVRDPRRGLYRRLTFRRQRLVGAVLLGDIAGSQRIQSLIAGGACITPAGGTRAQIAFGLDARVDQ
jgi:nitrite reductase (NADH) large subunit